MKIIIWLTIGFCLFGTVNARADRYGLDQSEQQTREYLNGMKYVVQAGTAVGRSAITFEGHGTDLWIGAHHGDVGVWTNFNVSNSTLVVKSSATISWPQFYFPVSSPTIVGLNVSVGATGYYRIGGLKKP